MRGGSKGLKISLGVIALLLTCLVLLYYSNIKLNRGINQLADNFEALKKNYEGLSKENAELRNTNKNLSKESKSLNSKMRDVEVEISKTDDKLNEFQITVQDSIEWFKQNVNIEDHKSYDSIKKDLDSCKSYNNGCRIDLDCINSVNKKNNFKYKVDEETSKKQDFLQDLNQIYDHKGGDCEDFSLLFRAEYNYLLNQCLANYTRNDVIPHTGGLEINKTHMFIVCGTWDPKETVTGWSGHCMVALSKAPINSTKDVYSSIKTSFLVEPQNGQFEGYMSKIDTIDIFPDNHPPNTLFYIDFVITDDDLKIFYTYSDDVKWFGYQDFKDYIKYLKTRWENEG